MTDQPILRGLLCGWSRRRFRPTAVLVWLLFLWPAVQPAYSSDLSSRLCSAQAVAAIVPSGELRVALNRRNPILMRIDAATARPVGVAIDMTHENRGADAGSCLVGLMEDMKASGFVSDALIRHRVDGVALAPLRSGAADAVR